MQADDGELNEPSGAMVLVVFAVAIVASGILWLRKRGNPSSPLRPAQTETSPRAPVITDSVPLTVGAMTRWSCSHERTLSSPLAAGVTPQTQPCPVCGCRGIVGQHVSGRYVPIAG